MRVVSFRCVRCTQCVNVYIGIFFLDKIRYSFLLFFYSLEIVYGWSCLWVASHIPSKRRWVNARRSSQITDDSRTLDTLHTSVHKQSFPNALYRSHNNFDSFSPFNFWWLIAKHESTLERWFRHGFVVRLQLPPVHIFVTHSARRNAYSKWHRSFWLDAAVEANVVAFPVYGKRQW